MEGQQILISKCLSRPQRRSNSPTTSRTWYESPTTRQTKSMQLWTFLTTVAYINKISVCYIAILFSGWWKFVYFISHHDVLVTINQFTYGYSDNSKMVRCFVIVDMIWCFDNVWNNLLTFIAIALYTSWQREYLGHTKIQLLLI